MYKIELIVPESDIIRVTEALANSGVFHLAQSEVANVENILQHTDDWMEWVNAFSTLEQRVLALMDTLGTDKGTPPDKAPYLISPEAARMEVEHLEHETQAPVRELHEEELKLTQLQQYVNQLKAIADLDVNLEALSNMRYTFILVGSMPIANIERLEHSLAHYPCRLIPLHQEDHLATVVLFGMQRDAEVLNRAARSAYLNPIKLPTLSKELSWGTPSEAILALEEEMEKTRLQIVESQAAIEHMRETRLRALRELYWQICASRTLVETITHYGRLRYTYLIAGWVPPSKVDQLKEAIQTASSQTMIEVNTPRREEADNIPVALENPPALKGFESLVTNYGYPRYGEMDPTPITAITFPLVFGIMFGDVGHGLLLLIIGMLLTSRKIHPLRKLADLGWVVIACGITSAIFGFIYGSIFGFEDILAPLWIRPMENIIDILLVTAGSGAALLSLGMFQNIINMVRTRHWGRFLFGHHGLAGLFFYWSLIGLGVSAFTSTVSLNPNLFALTCLISGLCVTFSEALEHLVGGHRPLITESLGTYLMRAIFELFETLIGLLSNTLSYVRMGAFAVAHGALSLVVFIIANALSNTHGLGYWLVIVLGNLFVIGFEGMIVGIQTLRLEYYEFFSKFFTGGGVRYHPLNLLADADTGHPADTRHTQGQK